MSLGQDPVGCTQGSVWIGIVVSSNVLSFKMCANKKRNRKSDSPCIPNLASLSFRRCASKTLLLPRHLFFFFPTASARSVMWCSAPVSPCLFSSLMMAYLLRCFGVPNTHTSLSKDSWMSVLASFGIRAHLVFYSFYFSSLQNAKPKSVCWTTAKWCA